MLEQLDKESLRLACAALRTAIAKRPHCDPGSTHALLRALTGLEHAAFNAPQNQGWLRARQIELRSALDGYGKPALSGADELQVLYNDIAAILQRQPRRLEPLGTKRWLTGGRF